jgi:hypothetical protein
MTILDRLAPALDRELLRKGVGVRDDDGSRRCGDCRRTPLVGERIYLYEGGRLACELCQPLHKRRPLGAELVHGPAYAEVVRLTRESA